MFNSSFQDNISNNWRKRVQKGFGLKLLILKVLEEASLKEGWLSAYEIQQEIFKMTKFWRPSPGSIYPVLQNLMSQDEPLIRVKRQDNKDNYLLTPQGREIFHEMLSSMFVFHVFLSTRLFNNFRIEDFPKYIPELPLFKKSMRDIIQKVMDQEDISPDFIDPYVHKIELEIQKENIRKIHDGIEKFKAMIDILQEKCEEKLSELDAMESKHNS
ncbi:MAG: PadR family transcriptional regulator [Candidatus Hodarchaeales archaeon]